MSGQLAIRNERLVLLLVLAANLAGQAPIEQHFAGRQGTLLLDLPGDESGIDVPRQGGLSEEVIRARLTKYGVALRRGQVVSVTLVKVKGDHIEFQLDGGGFTDRQFLGLPGYDSVHWGTSEEERKIRSSISGTRDKERRRRLESEYDTVRRRRVRPLRDNLERERRAQHGSRFNIRFATAREAARATPEEVRAILQPYLRMR